MKQLELHNKIFEFFKQLPASADLAVAHSLVGANFDAKNFFFSVATPEWFDWLEQNGFLDDIKQPPVSDGAERYYHSPEIEYLVRVSESKPDKFAMFFQSFAITEDNFDVGILNRVIWAMEKLPAPALKLLAIKARDEKWSTLLNKYRHSGYQYDGMFKTFSEAGEWEGLLALAESLLLVQPESGESVEFYVTRDNPFYVDDLSYSNVFSSLSSVPKGYQQQALSLLSKTISSIVTKTAKEPAGEVFPIGDNYYLIDIDFFDLDIAEQRGHSFRDDVKNLAASFKELLDKTLGQSCDNETEAKRIFEDYIGILPDSRSMWRLRLFAMSRCPQVFKLELHAAFFRLFEVEERYSDIDGGAEYQKTLQKCFDVLEETDQRKFITNTFEYFTKQAEKHPDQSWHLRNGWETLSSISEYLTEEDKKACKEKFGFDIDPKYEPEPAVGQVRSGTVVDRSPVNLAEFTISQIIEHLRDGWSPEQLKEQYEQKDDFLSPRNAEGLGNALKDDLQLRTAEYMENAEAFFDRESIHPHYTYSFLRGIEDMLRDNKLPADFSWQKLFAIYEKIRESGEREAFPNDIEDGRWLARWVPVHDSMADGLLRILTDTYDKSFPFTEYREKIFGLIKYYLTINDPTPEHEEPKYGHLHGVAINSVRGRAFQVLTHFIYYDGNTLPEGTKVKLKDDVKELYLNHLQKEDSLAVRFMFGHYIPPYFFRDKTWFESAQVFDEIFPKGQENRDKYIAAWEGYLTSNLQEELFELLQPHYVQALDMRKDDYTDREYVKSLDEALGTHIALAFVHYSSFTIESELFKALWKRGDTEKQREFVSFIGRHVAHRSDEWREENKVDIEKIKALWDWILRNVDEPEVLSAFGHWVAHERDSFEPSWLVERVRQTVVQSGGNIDWDYGIIQQLENFANINSGATLEILEHYLLQGDHLNPHRERWMMLDRELQKAIEVIYQNESMKGQVYEFVNRLIVAGGQQFWPLRDIVS